MNVEIERALRRQTLNQKITKMSYYINNSFDIIIGKRERNAIREEQITHDMALRKSCIARHIIHCKPELKASNYMT